MRWLAAVSFLVGFSLEAQPQAQTPAPDAVVREYFDAIEKGRFLEASRHLDTGYFADSKRDMMRTYRNPRRRPAMTVEAFMQHDPEMPRAVAEYQMKQFERSALGPEFAELEYMFADVPDTTALKLLSARELAARWLEARDWRYQVRRTWRSNRCPPGGDTLTVDLDSIISSLPVLKRELLGIVRRRDTAFAVFREAGETIRIRPPVDPPRVLTLVLRDRWRVVPDENLSMATVASACGTG